MCREGKNRVIVWGEWDLCAREREAVPVFYKTRAVLHTRTELP